MASGRSQRPVPSGGLSQTLALALALANGMTFFENVGGTRLLFQTDRFVALALGMKSEHHNVPVTGWPVVCCELRSKRVCVYWPFGSGLKFGKEMGSGALCRKTKALTLCCLLRAHLGKPRSRGIQGHSVCWHFFPQALVLAVVQEETCMSIAECSWRVTHA